MDLVRISRIIERNFFWGLVGALMSVVVIRFLILLIEVNVWVLVALIGVGIWSGIFVFNYSKRSDDELFESLRSKTPRLRAFCLKAMLWLLGTAAVIGVLTVLTASYDILGRVGETMFATAIAAAFLWPLSFMVDRSKQLLAGIYGMATVVVVYCLVIPQIWDLDRYPNEIFATCLVIGLISPLGMITLLMSSYPSLRMAGRWGTLAFVLSFASLLGAAWHPGPWQGQEYWWKFGLWLIPYGGLSVACIAGMKQMTIRNWRWIGMATSMVAWLLLVINSPRPGSAVMLLNSITLLTSISVVVAHLNLTLLLPLGRSQLWVRTGTAIAMATTAVFLNLEVWLMPGGDLSLFGRNAGAAGIAAACGSLALIVLARLNQNKHPSLEDAELTQITLMCPVCGKKQTLRLGGANCSSCGLVINVGVTRCDDGIDSGE